MANGTTVNGERGSHEPLNLIETVQSASALAPEARAPRRPRPPEPGESPGARKARKLLELAADLGWHKMDGEDERAYVVRIDQLNQQRLKATT